jgi:hexosaminidase
MKELHLTDENELQSYFIQRIEKFVNSKGRHIIGWDEILEGGLAPNATVMSWRGIEGGIEAARQDHNVIMTPYTNLYFDFYQSESLDEPLAIGGYIPLDAVYNYEPVPDELNEQQTKHILGAQANVWTEYMSTPEHVEYMTYPRAIALAEVAWSNKNTKNYEDFTARLQYNRAHLKAMHVHYKK